MKLFWINYKGEAIFEKNIQPRENHTQNTYAGHPWLLTRVKQKVCIYRPNSKSAPNEQIDLTIMPDYEVTLKRHTNRDHFVGRNTEDFDYQTDRHEYSRNYNIGSRIPYIININNKSQHKVSYGTLNNHRNFTEIGLLASGESRAEKTYSHETWAVYRGNEQLYVYDPPRNLEPNTTINLNVQIDNEHQHDMRSSMHSRTSNHHRNHNVPEGINQHGMRESMHGSIHRNNVPEVINEHGMRESMHGSMHGSIHHSRNNSFHNVKHEGLYRNNIEHVVNDLRQFESRIPVRINFINKSYEDLIISSTDRRGNQELRGPLRHKQVITKKTFATHPWIISRKKEKICVYIPDRNLSNNTEINLTVLPNFEVIIQNAKTMQIIHRHTRNNGGYMHHNDRYGNNHNEKHSVHYRNYDKRRSSCSSSSSSSGGRSMSRKSYDSKGVRRLRDGSRRDKRHRRHSHSSYKNSDRHERYLGANCRSSSKHSRAYCSDDELNKNINTCEGFNSYSGN